MMIHIEGNFIESPASAIIELYRSSAAVSLSIGESALDAQAFVCVLRRDDEFQVCAALHAREIKRSLIYVADRDGREPGYKNPLKKATAFIESHGFHLEAVNLQYSPAMREVVLREIPVLLSPENAAKFLRDRATELNELNALVAEQKAEEQRSGSLDSALPAAEQTERRQEREARAAAARTAAQRLAGEVRRDAQAAALRQVIEKISDKSSAAPGTAVGGAAMEKLEAEKSASTRQVEKLRQTVKSLEEKIAADEAARKSLLQTIAAGEKRIAEFKKSLRKAEKQLEIGAADRKKIEQDSTTTERRLAEIEADLEQLQGRLKTELAEKKDLLQGKMKADKRLAAMEKTLAEKRNAAETANQQEPAKAAHGGEERLAELVEALRQAEKRIDAERQEREDLQRLKEAQEKSIADLQQALQDAEIRRIREVRDRENSLKMAERRLEELNENLRQMARRFEDGQTETERLPTLEKRLADLESTGSPVNGTAQVGSAATAPEPHLRRRPPLPGAFFHVDWDLAGIPASESEICEFHRSINMVQLCLEGYPNQYCEGYLVVLKKTENKEVFITFRLTDSNRFLIYVPADQPASPSAFAKAMKEAGKFLKSVGLDSEQVPLEEKEPLPQILSALITPGSPPRDAGNS